MIRNIVRLDFVVLAILGLITAASISGLAAGNAVPATMAGDGAGVVSGYSVTNVNFTLNAVDPTRIVVVQFDIAPAAAAQVKLGGNWYSCANGSGNVTCATAMPPLTLAAATSLQVVAAQ